MKNNRVLEMNFDWNHVNFEMTLSSHDMIMISKFTRITSLMFPISPQVTHRPNEIEVIW